MTNPTGSRPRLRPSPRVVALVAAGAVVLLAVAVGVGVALVGPSLSAPPPQPQAAAPPAAPPAVPAAAEASPALPAAPVATAPVETTPSVPTADARLASYRGLGMWVDIWDDRAWKDPAAAVKDMAAHGVRTLFIETGNSSSKTALKDPAKLEVFIREAHSRDMFVVAWYLPDLKNEALDISRVLQAVNYRTSDGQAFDSFALDIESGALKPERARNTALENVSVRLRAAVGAAYPLGAIIPSPVGLSRNSYWSTFPYAMLARTYDVFLPMSYYTYHGKGGAAAYADTAANISILRSKPGCADVPINLIGGIAEDSTEFEAREFVRAANAGSVIGVGFYGWTGTGPGHWRALATLAP